MSELNDIIQVVISRETQAISITSFGTAAIISEFLTSKTTPAFDRYREYASTDEMVAEGWLTTDPEYKAANILFSQSPKVDKVLIGRIDKDDASLTAGLTAIQIASADWYAWDIVATASGKIVFNADFVSLNEIIVTVNGTAVTMVPFNTDHDTTMNDIITQIEADIANSTVILDPDDVNNRTLLIEVFGGITALEAVVTLGASQPIAAVTFDISADVKECAAWNETQKKIFFYASSEDGILDAGSTTDLVYLMKNLAYDRTVSIYHPDSQEGSTPSWIEAGIPGEALPFDPGSQTWAYKTISGVVSYGLTSSQRAAALGKNCNIYTVTAGVNVTEEGKVASGEYIDIIRGLDWLESTLQTNVFANLVNKRKIPFTDEGAATVETAVKAALSEGVENTLIAPGFIVTMPKIADVSAANKLARNLPDVKFTAILQGAIHSVEIDGTVTV